MRAILFIKYFRLTCFSFSDFQLNNFLFFTAIKSKALCDVNHFDEVQSRFPRRGGHWQNVSRAALSRGRLREGLHHNDRHRLLLEACAGSGSHSQSPDMGHRGTGALQVAHSVLRPRVEHRCHCVRCVGSEHVRRGEGLAEDCRERARQRCCLRARRQQERPRGEGRRGAGRAVRAPAPNVHHRDVREDGAECDAPLPPHLRADTRRAARSAAFANARD